MKKYCITSFGCAMNSQDSEKIAGILNARGFVSTGVREEADIIVFNTCAIRDNAENKAVSVISSLKKLKKEYPKKVLCVLGCFAQQEGVAEMLSKKYPFIDIIFGTNAIHKFDGYLDRVLGGEKRVIEILKGKTEIVEGIPIDRKHKMKALVSIQYGCDNFCSFCVVPHVKGREVCRSIEDICTEVESLANSGYKEIQLLGQNVNSYGKGLGEGQTFSKLLQKLNMIDNIERIRFMSSHPKDVPSDLIDTMKTCAKVMPSFHLPIQSASNTLLKAMNRPYTREQYIEIVNSLKSAIPNIAITTDLIVGFPGETEKDVIETIELIHEVGFDSAFTYMYSRRNNTPADMMDNQIPQEIKKERFNRVLEAVELSSEKQNLKYVGKIVSVLVEEVSLKDNRFLIGRTDTGKLVRFEGDSNLVGGFVDVLINKARRTVLVGQIIVKSI